MRNWGTQTGKRDTTQSSEEINLSRKQEDRHESKSCFSSPDYHEKGKKVKAENHIFRFEIPRREIRTFSFPTDPYNSVSH